MALIDNTASKFIGSGLIFPIQLDNTGKAIIGSGGPLIISSISIILGTAMGTRYMLGEFGANMERLLQEPDDEVLKSLVKHYVKDAVTKWEKRVKVLDVTLNDKPDEGIILLNVTYQIIGTKLIDTFTFPYYSQIIY